MPSRISRLLLGASGLVVAACGGGNSAPTPIVDQIPDAIAAVEAHYGVSQEYFEVSARLNDIGIIVAVDDATAAEQGSWSPETGLSAPVAVGEADGATFSADQIDFDANRIFTELRDELDDPAIVDFAIQGGPNGTVIYDATIASDAGGVILVLLGPDGSIRGVQGQ